MTTILPSPLPTGALLARYAGTGAYVDCYYMDVSRQAALSDYVASFYTSPVFKVERKLLALFARRPATDADAHALADDRTQRFSAWSVEGRTPDQLLLKDFMGRTRSWLMTSPLDDARVRLYFGSAVMPKARSADGKPSFGLLFHALTGFHRLYTKALMRSARGRLLR